MSVKNINTDHLTLSEKTELALQLTIEVVDHMKTESFANISESNKRLNGLMRTLGGQYVSHMRSLKRQTSQADVDSSPTEE